MVATALAAAVEAARVVAARVAGLGNWGSEQMVPALLLLVWLVNSAGDVLSQRLKTLVFGYSSSHAFALFERERALLGIVVGPAFVGGNFIAKNIWEISEL